MNFFKLFVSLLSFESIFSQNICDNCIDSQNRGENIDCTIICQGQVTHLTDCLQYSLQQYYITQDYGHRVCLNDQIHNVKFHVQ